MLVDTFPATFRQESLYRASYGGESAINVTFALRIVGHLDVSRLRWAIACVTDRHPVLRTTLGVRRGEVVQHVAAPGTMMASLEVVPGASLEAMAEHAVAPFRLDGRSLARFRLYAHPGNAASLVVTMHQAISDSASCGVLAKDLLAYYMADDPGLSPQTFTMADLASYERTDTFPEIDETLTRMVGDAYTPFETMGARSYLPARVTLGDFPEEALAGLRQFTDRCRVPFPAVIAAAVQVALPPSAQPLLIGNAVSNREYDQLAPVVGGVADQIPVVLPALDTIGLQALTQRAGAAMTWSGLLPSGRLASALGNAVPLFGLGLNVQRETPGNEMRISGATFRRFSLPQVREPEAPLWPGASTVDVHACHGPRTLTGHVRYNALAVKERDAELLARRVAGALRTVADEPDISVPDLRDRLESVSSACS